MKQNIWDFWAKSYDRLWVQKYSLKPTRNLISNKIKEDNDKEGQKEVLDLGCGPGELIDLLESTYKNFNITGVDFSQEMLNRSKARNSRSNHINLDVSDLDRLQEKFDMIICTHSLPYYKNIEKVVIDLDRLLEDNGQIYIAFASGDSLYDKLALSFVKLTTGPAYYPSDKEFRKLVSERFKVESLDIIRERLFMPRIAIYKLAKVMK